MMQPISVCAIEVLVPFQSSVVAGCDGSDDGAVAVSARHVLASPSQSKRLGRAALRPRTVYRLQRWVALWGSTFMCRLCFAWSTGLRVSVR